MRKNTVQFGILSSFLVLALGGAMSRVAAQVPATHDGWTRFDACPVIADPPIEVPARHRGVLATLLVEKNDAVIPQTIVATLDKTDAEQALYIAEAQRNQAAKHAADSSDLAFRKRVVEMLRQKEKGYSLAGSSVTGAEKQSLELELATAENQLRQAMTKHDDTRAQKNIIEAKLNQAKLALFHHDILAPSAGVVTEIKKRVGEWVEPGETVVCVRDMKQLTVDILAHISAVDRSNLKGRLVHVEIAPDTQTDEPSNTLLLEGVVQSYDHEVSTNGMLRIHTRVRNTKHDGEWVLLPSRRVTLWLAPPPASAGAVSLRSSGRARVSQLQITDPLR